MPTLKFILKILLSLVLILVLLFTAIGTTTHFRRESFKRFCNGVSAGAPVTGFLSSAAEAGFEGFSVSENGALKSFGFFRKVQPAEVLQRELELAAYADGDASVTKVIFMMARSSCIVKTKKGIIASVRESHLD